MHVRFERSDGMLEHIDNSGETREVTQYIVLGPFEWVQMTYGELRIAPDGDVLAFVTEGHWFLVEAASSLGASGLVRLHTTKLDRQWPFSDVIVYGGAQ